MTRYPEQVSRLIACLEKARRWPAMLFGSVAVEPAKHFLAGLDFALGEWLGNSFDTRLAVQAERGWPQTDRHPAHHMAERGLTPAEIVDELLVIEIETLRRIAAAG